MIAFIDDHRRAYGVEPICRDLPGSADRPVHLSRARCPLGRSIEGATAHTP